MGTDDNGDESSGDPKSRRMWVRCVAGNGQYPTTSGGGGERGSAGGLGGGGGYGGGGYTAGSARPGYKDGPGHAARFNSPQGIALTPDGSLIVCDTGNHVVRKLTPATAMAAAAVAQHADDGGSPSPSPEHARLLRAFESVWEIWEAGTSAAKAK